jgi:hypothetical protein
MLIKALSRIGNNVPVDLIRALGEAIEVHDE